MIKFFQKYETDKYVIIKILFIKITFKKKMPSINLGYINKELNDIYNYRNIENNL